MVTYDVIGSIAILKGDNLKKADLMRLARKVMKTSPSIKTVVEKVEKFKGRLRTIKVRHVLGEKNIIALSKESGCVFKIDVTKAYFSSRLANERLEIAKMIKKGDRVLVMFSGVAPFPIVIAKHSKPKEIVAVELGRAAHKFAEENVVMNHVGDKVRLIQGDVKKKVNARLGKFDIIIMPRPKLKDSFLKQALSVSKKGTRIIYYGFGRDEDLGEMIVELKNEAGGKIKILKKKRAGDIGPYKYRYRIEMRVI